MERSRCTDSSHDGFVESHTTAKEIGSGRRVWDVFAANRHKEHLQEWLKTGREKMSSPRRP